MENGEKVIISGRAKPKTNLLVVGIFMIFCFIGSIVLTSMGKGRQDDKLMTIIIPFLVGMTAIVLLRFYFQSKKSNITVTSKRITGATAWGNTVDLPLGQVNSATIEATGALIISTNSEKMIFAKMDNTSQIFAEINKLLMSR